MTSGNDPHPRLSELAAFERGELAPGERAVVESHVSRCAECRARLTALAEATRASHLGSSADLADTGPPDADGATSFAVPSFSDADPSVPPELANHPRYR